MAYNTEREMFPTNIIAGMFNFRPGRAVRDRQARGKGSAESFLLVKFGRTADDVQFAMYRLRVAVNCFVTS